MWGLKAVTMVVLGKTTLHKLHTRKVGLCECRVLIEPPSLKIHTHFDIKHLHSAWIVQAVSFIGR